MTGRKLAIIDKNPLAKNSQWRAAPEPKKFFHKDATLIYDIAKYNPDWIFINKGHTFNHAVPAIKGYKSIYFYGDYYRPIPQYVINYASLCDIVIMTNKDKVLWKSLPNKNIYFVSQGTDVDIFKPIKMEKKYDILFTGNYLGTKFCGSKQRLELVRFLQSLGYNFKVIGEGWPSDINAEPRVGMVELNKKINQARVTVGMSHFTDVNGYTSNRLYQSMATGVPHIAWYSPGIKQIFKNKKAYLDVKSYDELGNLLVNKILVGIEFYTKHLGRWQREEIVKHHTIFHFWNQIERIINEHRS